MDPGTAKHVQLALAIDRPNQRFEAGGVQAVHDPASARAKARQGRRDAKEEVTKLNAWDRAFTAALNRLLSSLLADPIGRAGE